MTRLIDADKIDFIYVPIAPVIKGTNVHYETVAFKEDIDEQPTIEAIPIEWLRDHCPTKLYISTINDFHKQLYALIDMWKEEQAERKENE